MVGGTRSWAASIRTSCASEDVDGPTRVERDGRVRARGSRNKTGVEPGTIQRNLQQVAPNSPCCSQAPNNLPNAEPTARGLT